MTSDGEFIRLVDEELERDFRERLLGPDVGALMRAKINKQIDDQRAVNRRRAKARRQRLRNHDESKVPKEVRVQKRRAKNAASKASRRRNR